MLETLWLIWSYGVPFAATFFAGLWLAGAVQGSKKLPALAFVAILTLIVVLSGAVAYSVNTVQTCTDDC